MYRLRFILFNFLLQTIECRSIKEFRQGDTQAITNHFDGKEFWILTLTIQDILNTGWRQCRYACQLVDADIALAALFQDSVFHRSNCIQIRVLPKTFLLAYTIGMDFIGYACYY